MGRSKEIMTVPQTRALIQHAVDLNIQLIAGMISLQALDLLDSLGEPHGQVEQHVPLIGRRSATGQVPDMRTGDLGIESYQGKDDREGIEDDVGHGVLSEGLDGAVLDKATPKPANEFDYDGAGHDDYGRDCQADDGAISAEQLLNTFEEDLEESGDHDNREDKDTNRLEATTAWHFISMEAGIS
ncbi:hypothetical protein KC328_g80 [Hortaea werneckii]|nr:hypothetical protein KC328_g80 [Hortaea werneckii]